MILGDGSVLRGESGAVQRGGSGAVYDDFHDRHETIHHALIPINELVVTFLFLFNLEFSLHRRHTFSPSHHYLNNTSAKIGEKRFGPKM